MNRLSEILRMPVEPRLIVREYNRTLEDWCLEMNLSVELEAAVMDSQLVLIPDGYRDCPMAFTNYASDFYSYCKHINGLRVEICCEEEDFTQLEFCSFKIRLGKIISPATISGVILWNVISGYVKDAADSVLKDEPKTEQQTSEPPFQSEPECSFSVIVRDTNNKYIEVKYDGPVSGMDEAGDQIIKIAGDGRKD